MKAKVFSATSLLVLLALAASTLSFGQVQTEVPPVVAGAKPVAVEHIKIHGQSLEGNLEGDAVDRDVFVFLPPSYEKEKHRRYPVFDSYGLANTFEIYHGTHTSAVADRFQNHVLPFFSQHLCSQSTYE